MMLRNCLLESFLSASKNSLTNGTLQIGISFLFLLYITSIFHIILFVFSLEKNYLLRPNYTQLMELSFFKDHVTKETDVATFVTEILDLPSIESPT